MLDRSKLLHEIELAASRLFFDDSYDYAKVCLLWERMTQDAVFLHQVKASDPDLALPLWQGNLGSATNIKPISDYLVVSIDGSQIYPDRHQGASCFLINVGAVLFRYGLPGKRVVLYSTPYVFSGDEDPLMQRASIDFVNCQREAFEFEVALTLIKEFCTQDDSPRLVLFDGSLIFWYLESKDYALRSFFWQRYCTILEQLSEAGIPFASYLSLPRNKDLLKLASFALQHYQDVLPFSLDHVLDLHMVNSFLMPSTRSTLFAYRAKLIENYPQSIRPYFFYLHVGAEIARVELPAWLAQDQAAIEQLASIIQDQAIKGYGYPVSLAEAHEQAVVKGPDRDFFYYALRRMSRDSHRQFVVSQKSIKKRMVGI